MSKHLTCVISKTTKIVTKIEHLLLFAPENPNYFHAKIINSAFWERGDSEAS